MQINLDFLHEHQLESVYQWGLPKLASIKDLKGRIVAATPAVTKLLGFNHPQEMIHTPLYDEELPCKARLLGRVFSQEDRASITDIEGFKTLNWCYYANNQPRLILNEKSSLLNKEGKLIGYQCQAIDITKTNMINLSGLVSKLHKNQVIGGQFSISLLEEIPDFKISKRQLHCLYYLLRGFTYPQIAEALKLSLRTVETHIEALKNKLYCDSKQQLIEKAISMGYLSIIPESILNQ